jgi:3-oxoacyl-(acyl-carrier-protein) synthase
MSEAAVLGCVAAHEAAEAAGLRTRFPPERVGLYAGTGLAAAGVDDVRPMLQASIARDGEFSCRMLGERGLAASNPLLSFKILANMPPCLVSIIEGVKGPNYIFTPWEGQTAAALLEAWSAVVSGEADGALCGAADNAAHPATLTYLVQSGRLAAGEFPAAAAAYLVLERAATARRDGRRILARIAGMSLEPAGAKPADPLAARMGRSFAAAPAVLMALGCQAADGSMAITGAEGETFRAELRAWP